MRYYYDHVFLSSAVLAAALDLLALAVVGGAVWAVGRVASENPAVAAAVLGTLLLTVLALVWAHGYAMPQLRDARRAIGAILRVGAAAAAVIAVLALVGALRGGPLGSAAAAVALAVPALVVVRVAYPIVLARTRTPRQVLIVGSGELARRIGMRLRESSGLGLEVAGYLVDHEDDAGFTRTIAGARVLGPLDSLETVLRARPIDHIVLASLRPVGGEPRQRRALARIWAGGVDVENGLAFYERLFGRIYLRDLDLREFSSEVQLGSKPLTDAAKRVFDLLAASLGLLVASPVLALAAVAIRLESPGPVLFGQNRIGLHGRVFRLYKLRSMRPEAERDTGPVWAGRDDDRITTVGRVLRKTRIDELPQLWNVLRGEMSLVGPRPERPEFARRLAGEFPYFWLRASVKPGLTGWAQVRQGYVNDMGAWENKLEFDIYYAKNRSLVMDVAILFETTRTLLLMHGL